MNPLKSVTFWSLIVVLGLTATAQSPSSKKDSKDKSATEKPTPKTLADFPDEPLVYEYIHATMRYENDGTGMREMRAKIHVQAAAGLTEAGQLVFDYNAANEKDIRSVKVIKPDGKIISAGPEAVQDLSAPLAREAPMYTDARQKHVTVPGLSIGDTVEYDVVTTIQPLMAGQFWERWDFTERKICLDEQLELNVPLSRAVKMKSPPEVEPTVREDGNRRIYHWTTSSLKQPASMNLPGTFDAKTWLEEIRKRHRRSLMLSTFQSWEEVGAWYAGLERDRRVVTPEIQAQADAIVRDQKTDLDKAKALYEWVSRNIRYVSLSFGVGRYQPHAAAEVLLNRYGDCKDKSTLLDALLEAEGLHGQTVLIGTFADLDPDLPSPLQFNHAINMVKVGGEDRWLDSTVGVGPFGYLSPQLRGKQALVVYTVGAPALQSSPSKLPYATLYSLEIKGELQDKNKMDATLSLDIRGEFEVELRSHFLDLSASQIKSMMEIASRAANKDQDLGISFSDFKTSDPADISKPFHAQLHISGKMTDADLPDNSKKEGLESAGQDFFRGMIGSGNSTSSAFAFLLPENPEEVEGPREYILKMTLKLPEKLMGQAKPWDVHIAKDFGEYQATLGFDNHIFTSVWRLKVGVPEIPPEQTKQYKEFRKQVFASMLGDPSKSAKKSKKSDRNKADADATPAAGPLSPATSALYTKAESDMEARNWGNAEQNLEKVVKDAPEYEEGWRNLGLTRMELRKYAAAETAFRKSVELAPSNSIPYQQLAEALTAQEKYDQAAEVLEKDLTSNPKDDQALRQLGFVHMSLHQPERAVHDLEKAVSISSDNAYGHFLLGSAYVDFNKHDKAASSFERAISLDSSGRMLNRAAYRLAEGKTHLDKAESWSARSIQEVEVELNEVTLQSIQANTATLLYEAGGYWDTMGWIKFQKNDLAAAEKYIRASWELMDDSTIGYHLARIYEAKEQKDKAIETYAEALTLVPVTRAANDDEKDARQRLGLLLGSESLVDERIKGSKSRVKDRLSIQIENSAAVEGITQYMVIVGPGSKLIDIQALGPDNRLEGATGVVRASAMPQDFPDETILKLPRTAILACARSDQPCRFSLLTAADSERTFPANRAAGFPNH